MHEYTPESKKPNHLNYIYATDQKRAFLVSNTVRLDAFLTQYFSEKDAANGQLNGIFPINRWRQPAYIKEIPPIALSPLIYSAEVKPQGSDRIQVIIEVKPQRDLNLLQLTADNRMTVHSMKVNGEMFTQTDVKMHPGFIFKHVMTGDQKVDIELTYSSQAPVNFRIVGSQFNLLEAMPNIKLRPDHLMPHPFVRNDATIISQAVIATR